MSTRPESGTEIWKQIDGFPRYMISSFGRVKSLKEKEVRILKPNKTKFGYLQARLFRNGISHTKYIHRLVAKAFINNPDCLPQVNHKNEVKTDNHASNLEWCACRYNLIYGTRIERMSKSLTGRKLNVKVTARMSKPVKQLTMDGHLIKVWRSTREAARNGFNQSEISKCCRNKSRKHHGYRWQFYKEEEK